MTEETHIHDPESHVGALESDLGYFRTKRLEPRVVYFVRRGLITFADLLRAHEPADTSPTEVDQPLERRIRRLEDRLDELITGIAVATVPPARGRVVIEDTRKERGDYDPFFRFAKRSHGGTLPERLRQADEELDDSLLLLRVFTRALVASGQVTQDQLDRRREELRAAGYRNGARIVARAWVDEGFKRRLLTEGRQVVRELDIPPGRLGKLGVAENTHDVHHVVVCTLCSCYPHDLLGDPPWWYRTDGYKERIVADPRRTLREMFDLDLPADVTVRVHDSTSDVRWMVIPQRPEGTDGMTEEELAALVTPESLVGTARALRP